MPSSHGDGITSPAPGHPRSSIDQISPRSIGGTKTIRVGAQRPSRPTPPKQPGSGPRPRSLNAGASLDPAPSDGVDEGAIVEVVLLGVEPCEAGDGLVEAIALAQVRSDGDPVA